MAKLNKDTEICISISSNPSDVGTTLHNACYEAQGLDFVYKAFRVTDLEAAIKGVRALNIRGCSVSMPFKQDIIALLDSLEPLARRVGAVNTVLNDNGCLVGHNTDVSGAIKTIGSLGFSAEHNVLILGAGGMARALVVAFQELGMYKVTVSSRNLDRASSLAEEFSIAWLDWDIARRSKADVLVNATPIGMLGYPEGPIFIDNVIRESHALIDVVVSQSSTALNCRARRQEKVFLSGLELTKAQMIDQYKIYTGVHPPLHIIDKLFRT